MQRKRISCSRYSRHCFPTEILLQENVPGGRPARAAWSNAAGSPQRTLGQVPIGGVPYLSRTRNGVTDRGHIASPRPVRRNSMRSDASRRRQLSRLVAHCRSTYNARRRKTTRSRHAVDARESRDLHRITSRTLCLGDEPEAGSGAALTDGGIAGQDFDATRRLRRASQRSVFHVQSATGFRPPSRARRRAGGLNTFSGTRHQHMDVTALRRSEHLLDRLRPAVMGQFEQSPMHRNHPFGTH